MHLLVYVVKTASALLLELISAVKDVRINKINMRITSISRTL